MSENFKEFWNKLQRKTQLKVIRLMKDMEPHHLIEGTYSTSAKQWAFIFGSTYKERAMCKFLDQVERSRPIAWTPKVDVKWLESNVKEPKNVQTNT